MSPENTIWKSRNLRTIRNKIHMVIPFKEFPKHLFECSIPPTPEEFIWKEHPVLPVRANNVGYVESTDENLCFESSGGRNKYGGTIQCALYRTDTETQWYNKLDTQIGSLERIIYECWNEVLPKNASVVHRNFNPWDLRPENLLYFKTLNETERTHRLLDRDTFTDYTVRHMIKIKNNLRPGIDVNKYWKVLRIPKAFIKSFNEKINI